MKSEIIKRKIQYILNRKFLLLYLFLFLYQSAVFPQFGFDKELINVEVYQSFNQVHANGELKIALKVKIENSWHINSNSPNDDFLIPSSFSINSEEGFELRTIKYPSPKELDFEFSEKPVSVFDGEILIGAVITVPPEIQFGKYQIPLEFNYQACNDVTCLPPNSVEKIISIEVVDNQTPITELNAEIFSGLDLSYLLKEGTNEDSSIAGLLESSGLFLSLIFVFLGGLALNLTPCVYPLIPITIGYFGGQSEGRTSKLFLLGTLYVLGIALNYSIVGVVTSLSGAVFGSLLQNKAVIIFIAIVFVVLSLSMFGVYEFKLPNSWVAKAGGAKSGMFGAFFMGLTMGIVAAPCIGPFVIGLVTYVATKGDPYYGFLMFFFMALGLGIPYLFLALFSGKIKGLPRAGLWMEGIKHIFGFILIGAALYFIEPILPKGINNYPLPVFMLLAALYILFIDKLANEIKGFRIFKTIFSILVITTALYMIWPSKKKEPEWVSYSDIKYGETLAANQKMIIDFYADWCIPCKELDAFTFSDERVIKRSKNFITFKVDMTQTMSDETEHVRNKFNIIGMPTVLIIDSGGNEVKRITGFVDAEKFLEIISGIN